MASLTEERPNFAIMVKEAKLKINMTVNPFVKVVYENQENRSKVVKDTNEPKWTEIFTFEPTEHATVEFIVYHQRFLVLENEIGRTVLNISTMAGKNLGWLRISNNKNQDVGSLLVEYDPDCIQQGEHFKTDNSSIMMFSTHSSDNSMDGYKDDLRKHLNKADQEREQLEHLQVRLKQKKEKGRYGPTNDQLNGRSRINSQMDSIRHTQTYDESLDTGHSLEFHDMNYDVEYVETLKSTLIDENNQIKDHENQVRKQFEALKIESKKLSQEKIEMQKRREALTRREKSWISFNEVLKEDVERLGSDEKKFERTKGKLSNDFEKLEAQKIKVREAQMENMKLGEQIGEYVAQTTKQEQSLVEQEGKLISKQRTIQLMKNDGRISPQLKLAKTKLSYVDYLPREYTHQSLDLTNVSLRREWAEIEYLRGVNEDGAKKIDQENTEIKQIQETLSDKQRILEDNIQLFQQEREGFEQDVYGFQSEKDQLRISRRDLEEKFAALAKQEEEFDQYVNMQAEEIIKNKLKALNQYFFSSWVPNGDGGAHSMIQMSSNSMIANSSSIHGMSQVVGRSNNRSISPVINHDSAEPTHINSFENLINIDDSQNGGLNTSSSQEQGNISTLRINKKATSMKEVRHPSGLQIDTMEEGSSLEMQRSTQNNKPTVKNSGVDQNQLPDLDNQRTTRNQGTRMSFDPNTNLNEGNRFTDSYLQALSQSQNSFGPEGETWSTKLPRATTSREPKKRLISKLEEEITPKHAPRQLLTIADGENEEDGGTPLLPTERSGSTKKTPIFQFKDQVQIQEFDFNEQENEYSNIEENKEELALQDIRREGGNSSYRDEDSQQYNVPLLPIQEMDEKRRSVIGSQSSKYHSSNGGQSSSEGTHAKLSQGNTTGKNSGQNQDFSFSQESSRMSRSPKVGDPAPVLSSSRLTTQRKLLDSKAGDSYRSGLETEGSKFDSQRDRQRDREELDYAEEVSWAHAIGTNELEKYAKDGRKTARGELFNRELRILNECSHDIVENRKNHNFSIMSLETYHKMQNSKNASPEKTFETKNKSDANREKEEDEHEEVKSSTLSSQINSDRSVLKSMGGHPAPIRHEVENDPQELFQTVQRIEPKLYKTIEEDDSQSDKLFKTAAATADSSVKIEKSTLSDNFDHKNPDQNDQILGKNPQNLDNLFSTEEKKPEHLMTAEERSDEINEEIYALTGHDAKTMFAIQPYIPKQERDKLKVKRQQDKDKI